MMPHWLSIALQAIGALLIVPAIVWCAVEWADRSEVKGREQRNRL